MKTPVHKTLFLFLLLMSYCGGINAQSADKKQTEQRLLDEARANIEKYRKGNASLTFIDAEGKKLKNLRVEVNQLTQDFLFGNLCDELFNPTVTPEEFAKYEKHFTSLFNFSEVNVKWTYFEKQQGKTQWALLQKKLDWCRQHKRLCKNYF